MTDQPPRLQHFNSLCALIFEQLYDNFPVDTELKFIDIAPQLEGIDSLDVEDVRELEDVCFHTLYWLEEEGLIRVRAKTGVGEFYGVRLTIKGFAVLGSVPGPIDNSSRQPVIDSIKAALGRSGSIISQESIRQSIGYVFRLTVGT